MNALWPALSVIVAFVVGAPGLLVLLRQNVRAGRLERKEELARFKTDIERPYQAQVVELQQLCNRQDQDIRDLRARVYTLEDELRRRSAR